MTVTGRLVLLLALGVVPTVVLARAWVPAVWALLVLALAGLDLLLAASTRAVRIERAGPARARLGEPVEVALGITNEGRRVLRGVVRDAWDPSAGVVRRRHPVRILPGDRAVLRDRLVARRRGERHAHNVTIRSVGPLGLTARQRTAASHASIRILPPFTSRRHLPSRLARLRELDGRTSTMIRGQGTEFDSLREYVRGDDVRSIDWRATARGRDVVVRTWRPERDRRVVVVVDTGRTAGARVGDEPRLDTAIEAALLLTALASGAGDHVDVLAYDRARRARVHGASTSTVVAETIDALATVEPRLVETDWSSVPGEVRTLTSRRALVVVVTPLDSIGATRDLLAMLPSLTRRHLVLVAAVSDPELTEASTQRDDRAGVYRAASAERALIESARLADAVRRSGGDVVTGDPESLPPALADRYIALKAAGRL